MAESPSLRPDERTGTVASPARSGAAPAPLLSVVGVHAGYGASEVLFGVDLEVGSGQIVGVLGRNGMGKTTLVRTVMGLVRARAGRIAIDGRETTGLAPNRIARLGVALVPEGRQVFANLSVDEHLSAFARGGRHGDARWTPARAFELFPRLAERRRHLGAQLSGGEQQMLAIARALVTNPALLILDEATEGLAPLVRDEIWRALAALRASGHAMIVIDKHVSRLAALADRCVVLEKGRVAWRGAAAELAADDALRLRLLAV